jgi:aldose 1-epimerase
VANASGEQYVLSLETEHGQLRATIAQVGASLRQLSIGSIDLVEPYSADQERPLCAGVIMSPWVNRLDGGRWSHDGIQLENPITIIDQNNANHGLLLDRRYDLVEKSESAVTLSAVIESPAGYPFEIETRVNYSLTSRGLEVTQSAKNLSAVKAPYATGAHPYFKFSEVETGELILSSDAETRTVVDERQIPISEAPTLGSKFDLRKGLAVGENFIDEDFTDLPLDENQRSHVYLKSTAGRGIDVWQDSSFKHVVIFTPNYFPAINGEKVYAAAIEPSTAAPNALNSGKDLIWLAPGQEFVGKWGVDLVL